jgi:hypothetical protein
MKKLSAQPSERLNARWFVVLASELAVASLVGPAISRPPTGVATLNQAFFKTVFHCQGAGLPTRTHTAMVPREEVEQLLAVTDQLLDIVENSVMKRVPKRLSVAVTRRARTVQKAVRDSLRLDSKVTL